MLITGFLVTVAFTVGMVCGMWTKYKEARKAQDRAENLDAKLTNALYWKDYYRSEVKDLNAQLRAAKSEAGLKVVATTTGPDSMKLNFDAVDSRNIAGGYRYPATNS